MAVAKPKIITAAGERETSLYNYVQHQRVLLESFFQFKKRYEIILVPLASAIGIFLTFKLYVPGGVQAHQEGAIITFGLTLLSCFLAIYSENKKSFEEPIRELNGILDDLKREG
jgi:hypothetical protein